MNIKEAEKTTGVSVRNIRFYEQKGLLTPARNRENDYREYSEVDIQQLRLIRALRMLDMSLEQIREIMDGKISLQAAAAQQRQKLKAQIEKMQTAARFCEELAKEENLDIEVLLTRMDKPENREMLSKKWSADHAETLKTAVTAFASGLLPLVLGSVLGFPMFIALMIHESAIRMLSLLLPLVWICLGYYFHCRGRWWLNLMFAHLFPAVICGLMEWQLELPYQQRAEWFSEVGTSMKTALMYFTTTTEIIQGFWPVLWVLLACFCLGSLICWIVPIFRFGWKHMYKESAETSGNRYTFWKKIVDVIPLKLIALLAVILLPIVIVVGKILFGPLSSTVTPETLQQRLSSISQVWVESEDMSYELAGASEFSECFRFDDWERVYLGSGSTEIILEVHLHSDRSEPYAIVFYDNGIARIYEAWITTEEGYFRIPDGVMEAVLEYTEAEGTPEPKNEMQVKGHFFTEKCPYFCPCSQNRGYSY